MTYPELIDKLARESTEAFRREKLIEECAELITSLANLVTKGSQIEEVISEMVDVVMCIDAFNHKLHCRQMYVDRIETKTQEVAAKLELKKANG